MQTRFLLLISSLFLCFLSAAQEVGTDRIWDGYLQAVNADYLANQVDQIDASVSRLYDRLDSKYSDVLVESTKNDIADLYGNKFITVDQKGELDNLVKLLDDYKNQAELFKSVFIHEINDPMINSLLKLETIGPDQVYMMTVKLWPMFQPKVNALTFGEEYKYLNTKLNRFKEIFKQITTRDSSVNPESYMDILQEALEIESELIEGHTLYFKLR